jgi:hypothetical protein
VGRRDWDSRRWSIFFSWGLGEAASSRPLKVQTHNTKDSVSRVCKSEQYPIEGEGIASMALNAHSAASAVHSGHRRFDKGVPKAETCLNKVAEQLDCESRVCSGLDSVSHAMVGAQSGTGLRWGYC